MLVTLPIKLAIGAVSALAFGFAAGAAAAQVPVAPPAAPPVVDSLALRVQTLYKEGKQLESLELLKGHLGHAPSDYLAWVASARAALVLGYAEPDPDSAKAWLHRSIAYGEGAQALNPGGEDGRYVTLAAKGRLALIEGPIEEAHLGREVEHEALALLAIDSLNAGAHNALGKVYFEIARLSRFQRFIAHAWLGSGIINRASWKAAEYHLRCAVELQPDRNYYHLDLGALLLARGRIAEARSELQRTLEVPLETPQQQGFRNEARVLLGRIP
ncbi:MAG: hypothetical protein ACYCVL_00575 [Gemmatimonadaceae bacterium]